MKYVSSLVLLAALCLTGPAFAQASSSQASSAQASSSQAASNANGACSGLAGQKAGAAAPAAMLKSATKVSIVDVTNCTGLSLADDPGGIATLATNASVQTAMKAAGSGSEIIGYAMDGATVDVYVKRGK